MNSYSQLRARAAAFIREAAVRGRVVVLAPVRAAADEAAFEGCAEALLGVHRFGFRDLALELSAAELARRDLVPVGRIVREALAARVTAQAVENNALTYLRPVAGFPGFPRALTVTFEELRLNAVSPETLRGGGQSGPDLALLLAAYERELAERRLADHATRVRLAQHAVRRGRSLFAGAAVVTIDLAPRSRYERDLLIAILRAAGARLELRLETDRGVPSSALESLQHFLFSADPVPARPDDGTVEIFSTSGEALECVEIARRIAAAADEGVRFDQIGILLRSPERHQPLVLEALRRARIPYHCARGAARPDVAGRAFLALLYCAQEGLSASRFAEYLSLGQIPDDEEPHTPTLWERLLVDAAVIGGPERWENRLRGLREEFHRRYRDEPDQDARAVLERRVVAIENLSAVALPLIRRLGALPESASWGKWIACLTDLAGASLREPDRVIELLEELEPMSRIGPIALPAVLLVLAPRLNTISSAPEGPRYGKVWTGSIEEARGLAFRRVFVPGVNEGLFPRPPAEDPLLLKAQREALGIDLRNEETDLLRTAVACASERLALSFSRLDLLSGRERVPSFYVFAASRAAGGPELGIRQFEDRARSATGTRIGWPAPLDPAEAIDDAEFDLSTLAPRQPGTGQYLKQLPGRAVMSLRARWSRWHKPWKASDGLVVDEIGSDLLKPYLLTSRAWSPSSLQQFARCPYRFALRGIYGLRPSERPNPIQCMDPATRGELYHAIQFELVRDLARRGALPVTPDNLDLALERLDAVLEPVVRLAEDDLAAAIPQIWHAETRSLRADLRGWLREKAAVDPDWTPQFAELSFGLKDPTGRDPRSRHAPVELDGGFLLQGSIDLVERHASGILRVVDHKTGRIPDPRPEIIGRGESLQPVLYGLAAGKIFDEPVAFGRLHYSTIAQNYIAIDVPLNEWTRQRAVQALRIINNAVRDGFLPAAPRKDGCKRCEYLPVCGPYEEERVREKSQPELKELKELRGLR